MLSDSRLVVSSEAEAVSSDDSSSELFDLSDKIAATAVFSSDPRDFFRFFLFFAINGSHGSSLQSSAEASDEDLETVRGIVSDCAEIGGAAV